MRRDMLDFPSPHPHINVGHVLVAVRAEHIEPVQPPARGACEPSLSAEAASIRRGHSAKGVGRGCHA